MLFLTFKNRPTVCFESGLLGLHGRVNRKEHRYCLCMLPAYCFQNLHTIHGLAKTEQSHRRSGMISVDSSWRSILQHYRAMFDSPTASTDCSPFRYRGQAEEARIKSPAVVSYITL